MMEKPALGIGLAIVTCLIIFLALELEQSLLDVFLGFIFFIIPLTFFNSFNSNFYGYFFTLILTITIYFSYSMNHEGFITGLILAALIGITISNTRIKNYKIFSVSDFEKEIEEIREK